MSAPSRSLANSRASRMRMRLEYGTCTVSYRGEVSALGSHRLIRSVRMSPSRSSSLVPLIVASLSIVRFEEVFAVAGRRDVLEVHRRRGDLRLPARARLQDRVPQPVLVVGDGIVLAEEGAAALLAKQE